MKEPPPTKYLFVTGIQVTLDVTLLLSAFAAAYLLRFDFVLKPETIRQFVTQIPMVVLVQFVGLTISGARSSIWRYTDLEHLKSFLYAALGSLIFVLLLRLTLPAPHQAWRVPLSVNVIDVVLAFGGAYAMRVLRRTEYEYKQKRIQLKKHNGNGNGHKKRPVLLIGAGRAGLRIESSGNPGSWSHHERNPRAGVTEHLD